MATQLIIIDPSVPHYDQLLAGISGEYDLLVLDQSQDGIQQIAAYLQSKSGYDAIQVFSHGSLGTLYLGSTVVNNSNLANYQAQLQQIGSRLTDTGDILLYGCNVAEDEAGNRFVNSLADYTGADIAASMNLTGSLALGGDWDLEASTGAIEASALVDTNYSGLLTNGLTISTNTQSGWGRTSGEFSNNYGFAVVKSDGSVVTWGTYSPWLAEAIMATELNGRDNSKDATQIFSNSCAFAALRADGSVVTWKSTENYSYDSTAVASQLDGTVDVTQIFSTQQAFAALRADGSVVTWGNYAGDSSAVASQLDGTVDVIQIISGYNAFAALRSDGSVVTWGMSGYDDKGHPVYVDSSLIATELDGNDNSKDVVQIISLDDGNFAALRADGSLVLWGRNASDSSAVASQLDGTVDVTQVCLNVNAFAALRADGSVVSWGYIAPSELDGTDNSKDVTEIFSTYAGFAALRADGSVVTWGSTYSHGNSSGVASQLDGTVDVTQIFSNGSAFSALRVDGSVVTWEYYSNEGGDSSAVASQLDGTVDVTQIFSNDRAFAALRSDGSVVTWGNSYFGSDSSAVASQLDGTVDVTQVFSNGRAFAALRADGSVVTWGDSYFGGDSSAVANLLDGTVDVTQVFLSSNTRSYNGMAFAALRADGSVVTWGDSHSGGDSSAVTSQIGSDVIWAANIYTDDVYHDPSLPPTASNLSTAEIYTEDTPLKLTEIVTADVDSANITAMLTLSNPAAGDLNTSTSGLVTSTYSDGVWTANGAIADVNTLMADLIFTPSSNFNDFFIIDTRISDGRTDAITGSKSFTGTAIDDAPTLTAFSSSVAGGIEDNEVAISFAALATQGDEADIDDAVASFVVKTVTSGSLRVGSSAETATAWDAITNNTLDATLNAYWTPDANANGLLDAFTAVAKDGGELESARAIQAQIAVSPVNDAPSGTVAITGTATQGQTLTVNHTLADADGLGAVSYKWKADGKLIGSCNSYVLTQADVGKAMTVSANYTDNQGNVESVNSVATAAVANINDLPTGAVTISGVVKQGAVLTASNTLADKDGLGTVSYVWKANNIVLGTANTQALTQAEVGKTITLTANYTDNYGAVESKTSTATAPVLNVDDLPTGEVTISGIAKQGEILTVSNTLADADGLGAVSYQWKANGAVIGSGNSYTLTQTEVGKTVTAVALYTDLLGSVDSKVSAATTAVANINDLPGGTVTISGTVKRGEVLTASNTLADADGLGPISYQWQAGGTVIGSGKTYLLTNAEVGKTVTVTASYLDKGNTAETVSSLVTASVAKNFTNLTIYGDQAGSKADVLAGMNGNDSLYGKDMNDKLSGDEGNDILYGGYGNDSLYGGEGNDTFYGEQDADYLQGDSGNDTLDGGLGKDTLIGGSGNDTYYLGYDVADVINDQGSISDLDSVIMPYQLSSYTLPANIEIGTITAGSQASDLTGNELDNTLTGNNGDNALNGAVGRDSLFGGSGNDELIGGSDSDSLNGGLGNDVLDGGSGNDSLIGGAGNDTYLVDSLNDVIIESGATTASARANATATSGIDTVKSTVSWALGANLENLILAGSAANGTGNDFANTLAGNAVNNNLTGGAGMDTLLGNNGNDTLTGGAGKDILTGGSGADIFKLPALSDSGITSTSRDTIKDFKAIQGDKIDLSAIDANTATSGNDAFSTFKAGGTFSGAFHNQGELYFDKNSHILYGNNDADTSADFSILLAGVSSLGAGNFIL